MNGKTGRGVRLAPRFRRVLMLEIVQLFDLTLRAVLTVPELTLFLGTALLLVAVGLFTWAVRRGKRM